MSAADPILRFLHRIDPVARRATFVQTDARRLGETGFLDGRTPFWTNEAETVPFDAVQASRPGAEPLRYIFHMSFCGSTLLARLVGEATGALALKEPHCLVDLADWRKALNQTGLEDPAFAPLLEAGLRPVIDPAPTGRPIVVKPSNWANTLLPRLRQSERMNPVFVTIGRREFLIAVFRGGRDRLAFTARAAVHLASAFQDGDRLIGDAIGTSADPLGRAANLAALAHRLQAHLFDDAVSTEPWKDAPRVDFSEITREPERALRAALPGLALEASNEAVAAAVDRWRARNAKADGAAFRAHSESGADEAIAREHGASIRTALTWAEKMDLTGPIVPR
ncbi:MAG TPA: hypothetical protein VGB70_02380 [Allosphingosinicella sp.]|jgi:hypothetical protein